MYIHTYIYIYMHMSWRIGRRIASGFLFVDLQFMQSAVGPPKYAQNTQNKNIYIHWLRPTLPPRLVGGCGTIMQLGCY